MAAQVALDVITGLLALATVALAFSSWRLGRESGKARADALGPQVMVMSVSIQRPGVKDTDGRELTELETETEADLAAWEHVQFGVRARVQVLNEGSRSALLRVRPRSGVDLEGVRSPTDSDDIRFSLEKRVVQRGELYVLPPGQTVWVCLVMWKAASDWASAFSSDREHPPLGSATLEFQSAWGRSVWDTCEVSYGEFALWPADSDGSWYFGRPSNFTWPPNHAPMVGSTGDLKRFYGRTDR
ncbi:MAG: hypothetical protein WBZ07_05340 [Candidatus Dormiibacterota bacterium]